MRLVQCTYEDGGLRIVVRDELTVIDFILELGEANRLNNRSVSIINTLPADDEPDFPRRSGESVR